MTQKTLARLFAIASSRLEGDYGNRAIYHLGRALSLAALSQEKVQADNWQLGTAYDLEIFRAVNSAKYEFKRARWNKSLRTSRDTRGNTAYNRSVTGA